MYDPQRLSQLMTAFGTKFPNNHETANGLLKISANNASTHLLYPYLEKWVQQGKLPTDSETQQVVLELIKR
jgi:hypothetical protein